jgi:hypothetical protein
MQCENTYRCSHPQALALDEDMVAEPAEAFGYVLVCNLLQAYGRGREGRHWRFEGDVSRGRRFRVDSHCCGRLWKEYEPSGKSLPHLILLVGLSATTKPIFVVACCRCRC